MPPLDRSTLHTIYHVRNVDVYRLKCLSESKERLDIMLSHNWPLGIEQHGDTSALLLKKPRFLAEVEANTLGNPAHREILDTVKPRMWFSAHHHVKFKATFQHRIEPPNTGASHVAPVGYSQVLVPPQVSREKKVDGANAVAHSLGGQLQTSAGDETTAANNKKNRIDLVDLSNESLKSAETVFHALESESRCGPPTLTDQMTEFLALDKCLPRRNYLLEKLGKIHEKYMKNT